MLMVFVLVLLLQSFLVKADINFASPIGACDANASVQCGGHGVCNPVSLTCTCDDLWSKAADFIEAEDCPTSLVGIYVLWAINVLEICYVLYSTSHVLVARCENFLEQRKRNPEYTLWKNKGLVGVMIYFSVCMSSHLIMCILRLVDPTSRIGFDIFPTVLFFTGKLGLYVTSLFSQGPLIATVLRGQNLQPIVRINYVFSFMISAWSILVGTFGFITYNHFRADFERQIIIMVSYYFLQAGCLLCNSIQAFLVKRWVFNALEAAKKILSSSDKTESIKRKIGAFQGTIIKQGLIQGIVYIIMGATPFFLNKHQYFLPISWLAMPILGKRLAFQFDMDKAGAKSIAERLGLKKGSRTDGTAQSSTKKKKPGESGTSFNQNSPHDTEPGTFMYSLNPASPASFAYTETNEEVKQPEKPLSKKELQREKSKKKKGNQVLSAAVVSDDSEGGMNEILKNEGGVLKERFTTFVRSKHAHESLAFYDACCKYQHSSENHRRASLTNSSVDSKGAVLRAMGHKIIEQFVKEGATQPVDMDHQMREELLEIDRTNAFTPTTFDKAKAMAYELLKANFYQQFTKSLKDENE